MGPAAQITSLLTFRAGITFLLSGAFILLVPLPSEAAVLLAVVFPQSACSFWPFAHMSAVRALENTNPALEDKPTFDLELGVNVLAVSMPFSILLILGVFTSGSYFTNPYHVLILGCVLTIGAVLPRMLQWIKTSEFSFIAFEKKELKDSSSD
jgi:hypothetical protein